MRAAHGLNSGLSAANQRAVTFCEPAGLRCTPSDRSVAGTMSVYRSTDVTGESGVELAAAHVTILALRSSTLASHSAQKPYAVHKQLASQFNSREILNLTRSPYVTAEPRKWTVVKA